MIARVLRRPQVVLRLNRWQAGERRDRQVITADTTCARAQLQWRCQQTSTKAIVFTNADLADRLARAARSPTNFCTGLRHHEKDQDPLGHQARLKQAQFESVLINFRRATLTQCDTASASSSRPAPKTSSDLADLPGRLEPDVGVRRASSRTGRRNIKEN